MENVKQIIDLVNENNQLKDDLKNLTLYVIAIEKGYEIKNIWISAADSDQGKSLGEAINKVLNKDK